MPRHPRRWAFDGPRCLRRVGGACDGAQVHDEHAGRALLALISCPAPAAAALALATGCAVGGLRVVRQEPASPYRRAAFGQAWADIRHVGCNTRNQELARDLAGVRRRGRCVVVAGTLHDPYTGRTIAFVKAHPTVQIDHAVALGNAWASGVSTWTDARRLAFANDAGELLAVDAAQNEAKSDKDTASWPPPFGQCFYVEL